MKMKIEYFPYLTQFTQEIEFNGVKTRNKEGYKLKGKLGDNIYHSEISIITPMHRVTSEEVKKQIDFILKKLENQNISFDEINLTMPLYNLYPSLVKDLLEINPNCLFGLENLFLNLILEYFKLNKGFEVQMNALFIPHPSTKNIQYDFLKEKYSRAKVKIGRLPEEIEISILKSILNHTSSDFKLRLDGNQKLSKEYLRKIIKNLDTSKIEYFEEPFFNFSLNNSFSYPLGIDESLEKCINKNQFPENTAAIIQKPSVKLAISGTLKLIKRMENKKIPIVISSCFENYESLKGLLFLATESNKSEETSHGLDTFRYLKCERPSNIKINGPIISIDQL